MIEVNNGKIRLVGTYPELMADAAVALKAVFDRMGETGIMGKAFRITWLAIALSEALEKEELNEVINEIKEYQTWQSEQS